MLLRTAVGWTIELVLYGSRADKEDLDQIAVPWCPPTRCAWEATLVSGTYHKQGSLLYFTSSNLPKCNLFSFYFCFFPL